MDADLRRLPAYFGGQTGTAHDSTKPRAAGPAALAGFWLDSVAPVIPDLAAAVVDAGRRPLGLLLLGAPRAV